MFTCKSYGVCRSSCLLGRLLPLKPSPGPFCHWSTPCLLGFLTWNLNALQQWRHQQRGSQVPFLTELLWPRLACGHACSELHKACQIVVYPLSKGKAVRDRVTGMALFGDRYGMGQPFGGGEFKQRPGCSAEAGGPVKEQEGHVFLLLTGHSLGDNKLT